MKILKFGGSSVSTPERIRGVITIVKEKQEDGESLAVVVSAFGGITDELIRLGKLAAKGEDYLSSFEKVQQRHFEAAESLVAKGQLPHTQQWLKTQFKELTDALQGISLLKELSARSLDLIVSFGERLCAYIISQSMAEVPGIAFLDAREIIKTDRNFGAARVDYKLTNKLICEKFKQPHYLPIVTGFIASATDNETTTLGRGGSDFTAAILGAALDVEEIEIWTDVDGVMTADPRKVTHAFPVPEISYKEALEMSHFGAKVIYPPTIVPAMQKDIPIRIKNTFRPYEPGTFISNKRQTHSAFLCGISSIDKISLFRLEGSGMIGVCGVAMRLFGALAKQGISVIMISQGSSEHSICFAIDPPDAPQAKLVIEAEFALEQQAGLIEPLVIEEELSIIAAVGEEMRNTPGIAGRLFGALGRNAINVIAVAQGSSELNISIVIRRNDVAKALNVIHEEFFSAHNTVLHVFIVGTGLIGSTLLQQLKTVVPKIKRDYGLELKLVGLANSKKMHFDPNGFSPSNWEELLEKSTDKMEIDAFIKKMQETNLMHSVFVDCTASEKVASTYHTILESTISIVTPNKKANSGSFESYCALKELSKEHGVKFLYETNVGAGLPVISTVTNLLRSGDIILKIEAILSGTLSYLFNHFTEGRKFSDVVKEAQSRGFTEPDPRDDLNGQDVLRKLLILARESGYPLEIKDIKLEAFLPRECFQAASVSEFYTQLEKYNSKMEELRLDAAKESKVLRYVAKLDQGKATISLQAVGIGHPFYHLAGSDNVIALTTERYCVTPLVIKGQGAGAEVTAGEVLADIIRVNLE